MAAPFLWTDLIVLSVDVDAYDIGYGGVNWGDSLVSREPRIRHYAPRSHSSTLKTPPRKRPQSCSAL